MDGRLVQDRWMLISALLLVSMAPPQVGQAEISDAWFFGEASGYCLAFLRQGQTQLVIRFAAKSGDDTLQVWREGLPSLTRGLSKKERAAAAQRNYDLALTVNGRPIPLTAQSGTLRPKNVPGRAYVLGVDEARFLEALATGAIIEARHRGQVVVRYHVRDNLTLANRLKACVATK
ncbi:MAG TPA: hypothetical protein VF655_06660 [Allosphingosinicella sp.]|jgi:hypothetical protein